MRIIIFFACSLMLAAVSAYGQAGRYKVGDIVENFTLINRANGQEVSLYDMEGKVIFLEWFTHWCPFCKAAAAQIGPGIIDHYNGNNGNPNGVPVMHVAINLQGGAETATQNYIDFYDLPFVLNDFDATVADRFQGFGQPIFAIINGVANSPSHQQWELMYSELGYGNRNHPIDEFRSVINQVAAAVEVPGYEDYLDDLGVAENQRAETDDPDYDGIPNVFEYFSGTSASDTGSHLRPVNKIVSMEGARYQAIEYVKNPDAVDVMVEAQFSDQPDFITLNGTVPYSTEMLEGGLEKVVMRSSKNLGSGSEFSRLVFISESQ